MLAINNSISHFHAARWLIYVCVDIARLSANGLVEMKHSGMDQNRTQIGPKSDPNRTQIEQKLGHHWTRIDKI